MNSMWTNIMSAVLGGLGVGVCMEGMKRAWVLRDYKRDKVNEAAKTQGDNELKLTLAYVDDSAAMRKERVAELDKLRTENQRLEIRVHTLETDILTIQRTAWENERALRTQLEDLKIMLKRHLPDLRDDIIGLPIATLTPLAPFEIKVETKVDTKDDDNKEK